MGSNEIEHLYTTKALRYQRQKSFGHASIVLPPKFYAIALLLGSILILTALFLYFGEYSRRTTVAGYLEPETGIVKILPSVNGGVLKKVFVNEGDYVDTGALLFELSFLSVLSSGNTNSELMLLELESQLEQMHIQSHSYKMRHDLEKQKVLSRIEELGAEILQIEIFIDLQKDRIDIADKQLEATQTLLANDAVSEARSLLSAAEKIEHEKIFATATQSKLRLVSEINALKQDALQLPLSYKIEQSKMNLQLSQIKRQIAELTAQSEKFILAPEAGLVTSIQAREGEVTIPGKPLMSIIPDNIEVTGKLLIPSNAVGFVSEGMSVHLMLEAYPFQEFGTIDGILDTISEAAIAPVDYSGPIRITTPVFMANVRLERNYIEALGVSQPLRPGMVAKADIILEKRTILNWILEPFFSMKGRN